VVDFSQRFRPSEQPDGALRWSLLFHKIKEQWSENTSRVFDLHGMPQPLRVALILQN
jgi:hypothetical protein